MDATVESLEIRIESDSAQASSGIDSLAAALARLKGILHGGTGLATVASQLKNLNEALGGINNGSVANLSALISGISNLGGVKISSSISHQLNGVAEAAAALSGTDFSGVSRLAEALQPLSSISKSSGLQSAITQLNKLPELAEALDEIDWSEFASDIQKLTDALAPLAAQLNTVSTAFGRLPPRIQRTAVATDTLPPANNRAARSYIDLWAKCRMTYNVLKAIVRGFSTFITESSDYVENINLFNASMGKYADEAQRYAETVGEAMGIDPGQFMRYQGVFNTMISGFGVATDRAAEMSKQLTQLGYDLASYYNDSFDTAMEKVRSGLSGEVRAMREYGFDLSDTRLRQDALTLGIEKSVSAMTQAEKTQLRYHEILTQVSWAHGDMARTLNAPANQLRILQAQITQCARAIGNIFIPMLNKVLPYLIAFAKVVREVANIISKLFGFSLPEVDYSGISGGASAMGDLADSTDDAAKSAKKLKNYLLGIDELNVLPEKNESENPLENFSLGGDLGLDIEQYDFLGDAVTGQIDDIVNKMREWLGITGEIDSWSDFFQTRLGKILAAVGAIGAGLLGWKIAKGLMNAVNTLSHLNLNKTFSLSLGITGALEALDGITRFVKYFKDFLKNGATFDNVCGMLSGFTETLSGIFYMMGNVKLGGALGIISGITDIVKGVGGIVTNGFNIDSACDIVHGLGTIMVAIGALGKVPIVGGLGLILQGAGNVIPMIGDIMNAIKTGDWSGVDKMTLCVSAIMGVVGIVKVIADVAKIIGGARISDALPPIEEVPPAVGQIGEAAGGLATKLVDVIKNLGLGIAIIGEAAVAAGLFAGAVIGLGYELQLIPDAWRPVIDNGQTTVTALGAGTLILATIGTLTGALGSVGGSTLIVNLALGAAILAEISVAAGLFVAEIWAMGLGLSAIGEAWQPVLDNGKTVAEAIGIGTGILVGVAAACGLLGVAATATGGLLPLAIGLGTLMLVEMGAAALVFVGEIAIVGDALQEVLNAWQPVLDNGDAVADAIKTGTALLLAVGGACALLGVATVASVGLLPLAIAAGTAMVVKLSDVTIELVDSLTNVADELTNELAPSLDDLNACLPDLTNNMRNFTAFMRDFAGAVVDYSATDIVASIASTIDTIIGWFTKDPIKTLSDNVADVGTKIAPLNTNLNAVVPELEQAARLLSDYTTLLATIQSISDNQSEFNISVIEVNMKDLGAGIVSGLAQGMNERYSEVQTAFKNIEQLSTTTANAIKLIVTAMCSNVRATVNQTKSNVQSLWTQAASYYRSQVPALLSQLLAQFTPIPQRMYQVGLSISNQAASGIRSGMGAVRSAVSELQSTLNNAAATASRIGSEISNGIAKGISDGTSAINKAVGNAAEDAKNSYKDALGIHSPSKVFKELGDYTVQGLSEGLSGIGSVLDDAARAINPWADKISDSMYSNGSDMVAQLAKGVSRSNAVARNKAYKLASETQADTNVYSRSAEYSAGTFAQDYDNTSEIAEAVYNAIIAANETQKQNGDKSQTISLVIGSREVFRAVVEENERALQRTGKSPLRV